MATSRSMNLPTSFPAMTHVVDLTESTIEANKRFFDKAGGCTAPRDFDGYRFHHARTAILLIATGADKADAVYAMVHGEISPQCPASISAAASQCGNPLMKRRGASVTCFRSPYSNACHKRRRRFYPDPPPICRRDHPFLLTPFTFRAHILDKGDFLSKYGLTEVDCMNILQCSGPTREPITNRCSCQRPPYPCSCPCPCPYPCPCPGPIRSHRGDRTDGCHRRNRRDRPSGKRHHDRCNRTNRSN